MQKQWPSSSSYYCDKVTAFAVLSWPFLKEQKMLMRQTYKEAIFQLHFKFLTDA